MPLNKEQLQERAQLVRIHEANCQIPYPTPVELNFRIAIMKRLAADHSLRELRTADIQDPAPRQSAYYLDSTWETRLAAFRTSAEPDVYQRFPDGSAVLDGYPIVWVDVLEPYGTAAAADKAIAVFGALSFWWMGEHGSPRIDTSKHVWFANDQLAVRFIEEIDFDYAAVDAMSVLVTAAASPHRGLACTTGSSLIPRSSLREENRSPGRAAYCRRTLLQGKAAEDCRTPKAGAHANALVLREASWTAAVLCCF